MFLANKVDNVEIKSKTPGGYPGVFVSDDVRVGELGGALYSAADGRRESDWLANLLMPSPQDGCITG